MREISMLPPSIGVASGDVPVDDVTMLASMALPGGIRSSRTGTVLSRGADAPGNGAAIPFGQAKTRYQLGRVGAQLGVFLFERSHFGAQRIDAGTIEPAGVKRGEHLARQQRGQAGCRHRDTTRNDGQHAPEIDVSLTVAFDRLGQDVPSPFESNTNWSLPSPPFSRGDIWAMPQFCANQRATGLANTTRRRRR